jgi:signal transduction histidine kinase
VGGVVEAGRALGVQVHAGGDPVIGLSAASEVAAYRIATEAILNAQRHGHADRVDLAVRLDGAALVVEVVDHGCGLGGAPAGVGLASMRERAVELGGSLVLSETPGGGVTVRATLPDAGLQVEAR